MKTLDNGNEKNNKLDTLDLLNKHDKGLINDIDFLRSFGKATVFYSTPFGDHKEGGTRLFLIPGPNGTGYFPVFSSQERAKDFYEKAGRLGFLIMSNSFHSVLVTTKNTNMGKAPVKMGIIIDPAFFGVTVDVSNLDLVIKMTE